MIVDIFVPCFIDQLYPETAFNMVKVLEGAGCKVNYIEQQTCCGQLAFNSGYWDDAKEVGEKFLKEFSGDRYIVVPSGSCCGFMRNYYGTLFENTVLHNHFKEVKTKLFEFTEFLSDVLNITNFNARLDGKATFHDGCGSLRECGIKLAPRRLLNNVKGLELIEMRDVETCCGFGGSFSIKFEPISTSMGRNKSENVIACDVDYLISGDLSCLMHIGGILKRNQSSIRPMHIADVLASGW
jgi:L-lactate dehydrogenase complex protein LldE